MLKQTVTMAVLAAALATPAFAQSANTPAQPAAPTMNAPHNTVNAPQGERSFIQQQQETDWRSSKLVGTSVYGPDNTSIGDINDVLIGSDGNVRAVVIGVGGLLGVGEKDVAVPFNEISIQRKPNSTSIDKITVSYTKAELNNAPKFAYLNASNSQTTGSGGATAPSRSGTTTPMSK